MGQKFSDHSLYIALKIIDARGSPGVHKETSVLISVFIIG